MIANRHKSSARFAATGHFQNLDAASRSMRWDSQSRAPLLAARSKLGIDAARKLRETLEMRWSRLVRTTNDVRKKADALFGGSAKFLSTFNHEQSTISSTYASFRYTASRSGCLCHATGGLGIDNSWPTARQSMANVAGSCYFFKNAENKSIGSGRKVVVLCSLDISRMV
jgi:hypothetical protein